MAITSLPSGPEYREVPDCPGFMAGTDGTLWTCWTSGRWPRRTNTWVRVNGSPTTEAGHLRVVLRTAAGFRVTDFLHRVILTTFVGPCPAGMIGCHDPDHDPTNCALSNLRWDTATENSADCKRHGRFLAGSRAPQAKLRDEDVQEVFRLRRAGMTQTAIAKRFKVGRVAITRVLRRQRYTNVPIEDGACEKVEGNYARGSRNPRTKLTEDAVRQMKRLRNEGWLQKALAEKFRVSVPTVSDILSGKYWAHVTV